MRKTIFEILCAVLILTHITACSTKNEQASEESEVSETDPETADTWPIMDEFHMLMSESFHPFKDSANLEPVKANAAEMANIAARWVNEPLPEKVNNETVKTALQDLKKEADALVETIKANDANQIGESLTNLHNTFHVLQDAWYTSEND